jgi:hypothetical protein
MHQQSLVPALLINIYRCRFDFCPQLYTFHLFFLDRPQIADMSTTFSLIQPITLSLTTLSVIKRMASNDNNGKRKMEEEAETSVVRERLWLSIDNGGNDDSSDSQDEEMEEEEEETETEEEVSSEESSMNQVDTSEDMLVVERGYELFFGDDGGTTNRHLSHAHPKRRPALCARTPIEATTMAVTTTTSGCS